ncbi:MAG: bifunctional adenosylcobinamide kinase/adenosylcobinamide-phosphate guanylyltransferase [Clostridium sp.]|uniref:bifunctional adenosylcobinamide kinase/adenosylcobinamide-phosphate guanylyltransferase n=1 Tax=Clostridium sp. TaxID=1506 RepID=UPI0030442FC3
MSKLTLVTGGCRSGKSTFGENIFKGLDDVLYIATAIVTDEEMGHRIKKHQASRNQKWGTLESYKDLYLQIDRYEEKHIFLDCVTIMTTNLMFDIELNYDSISDEKVDLICNSIKDQFTLFLEKCRELDKDVVLITNEIGWGIVPENRLSRIFRDIQGLINQHVANTCDEVYLVCCGQGLKIKG